ncbi:hypothetical protein [Campylobacter rectus]|uniref:hypothetical protein n=1 Tax=Campylobacter rectus TaxID=203 RepID=UPI000F602E7D|nr:hypothetical protein [Campylobacter rectus]RRD53600.1 hypothetical protein EII16_08660 [Campylobacter rectus]
MKNNYVPLTTKIKGYLFEVIIKGEKDSVVLVDYVKSLNWQAGNVTYQVSILPYDRVGKKLDCFFGNMMKNF